MSKPLRIILIVLLCAVILAALIYVTMLGVLIWKVHHVPQSGDYDAIIILGSQVKRDGTPNVQLQWRLDKALEIWAEHPVPVVVCGAQGSDEPRPEADVMFDYLTSDSLRTDNRSGIFIPADMVLVDPTSFNTRQNLQNASALLEGRDVHTVLIVTSDYHLPRALALAEDEGFTATGVGSPIKGGWNTVRNYARETVAWLKYLAEKAFGFRLVVDAAQLTVRDMTVEGQ
jgi:uncharacterized SAM-binding protein YcdF (DUF218 family)